MCSFLASKCVVYPLHNSSLGYLNFTQKFYLATLPSVLLLKMHCSNYVARISSYKLALFLIFQCDMENCKALMCLYWVCMCITSINYVSTTHHKH